MNKKTFMILLALLLISVSCKEKIFYPEVTQLSIRNRDFMNICRDVLNSADIYNKSLDSTFENYNTKIENTFVVNIFKQTIEEKIDTFFQFVMINKLDLKAAKFYGYFDLSDKSFFIFSENENKLVNLIFEKLPYKSKFPYLFYDTSPKKNKSNTIIPLVDTKYRTYKYTNGHFVFFREMY